MINISKTKDSDAILDLRILASAFLFCKRESNRFELFKFEDEMAAIIIKPLNEARPLLLIYNVAKGSLIYTTSFENLYISLLHILIK